MINSPVLYALRVAGYGTTDSTYGGDVDPAAYSSTPGPATLQRRFSTFLPSSDPGGALCIPVLTGLPSELESTFEPHVGNSVTGGIGVALMATPTICGFFLRPRHRILCRLTVSLTSGSTTIQTDDLTDGLEGTYIWIGQECIYLHTSNGSGEYGCFRGQLATTATAHTADDLHDTAIFDASHGHNVIGRRVELVALPATYEGLLEDVEDVLWRGIVREVEYDPEMQEVRLSCASLLDLVREGQVCRNPWRGRLRDFHVPDRYAELNAPNPGVYEAADNGRRVLYNSTRVGINQVALVSDGTRVFYAAVGDSGREVLAPLGIESLTLPFRGSELRDKLSPEVHEVYGLGADAPGNLPVNAVDLVYHLLTATDDTGLGIPVDLVDGDRFDQLSALYGDVLAQPDYVLGVKGPVDVWAAISTLMRPACMALGQRADGVLTLIPYGDALGLGAATLDDDDVRLDAPLVGQTPMAVRPVARINVEYASRVGAETRALTVEAPQARDRYPVAIVDTTDLKLPGVSDPTRARRLGVGLAAILRAPIPGITVEAMPDVILNPGDVVLVTLSDVVDADGQRNGVVQEPMLVVSRIYDLDGFRARYRLLRHTVGVRRGGWHLSALVTAWDGVDLADIHPTEFLGADNVNGWSATWQAWYAALQVIGTIGTVGLKVALLDATLAQQGTATLDLAGPDYMYLSSATATPSAGWVVVPADYDDAEGLDDEAIWPYFVYIADTAGTLGAGADDAYEWGL